MNNICTLCTLSLYYGAYLECISLAEEGRLDSSLLLLPILLIPLEPVRTLLLPDDIAEGRGYPGPGVLRGRGPVPLPPPLMEASRLDVRPGLSSSSDDPDWRE